MVEILIKKLEGANIQINASLYEIISQ